MAFVVEDGTGKSDANSYVSVTFADIYWCDRNENDWVNLTLNQKYAALIKATDYLDSNYTRSTGTTVNETQALQWPAYGAYDPVHDTTYDSDIVPERIKQAICILAKAFGVDGTDLNAPIDRVTKREKVGPIEVEYADWASSRQIQVQVDGLLVGIMDGGVASSGQMRFYRG